jgi:transposase
VGYDAGKKVKGRKRHAVVDTLGLMLGVDVLPANIQDRDGCLPVLKEVRRLFPFLQRIVADGGYQGANTAAAVRQAAGAPLEIVKRPDAAKGFVTLPKRWIVERTFGWLKSLPAARPRRRAPLPHPPRLRPDRHDPDHDAQTRKSLNPMTKLPDRLSCPASRSDALGRRMMASFSRLYVDRLRWRGLRSR